LTGGRKSAGKKKGQIAAPRGEAAYLGEEADETGHVLSILPAGVVAWQQLFRTPLRCAPWPYSDAQFAAIMGALPKKHSDDCFEHVLDATRFSILVAARYFVRFASKQKTRPTKPNPRKELDEICRAATALLNAVRAASDETRKHLARTMRARALSEDQLWSLDELRFAVDSFLHANRIAFRMRADGPNRGPARKLADETVVFRFWQVWKFAHGGEEPPRGWPGFLELCVEPLHRFGLAHLGKKSWEDVLANAKERARKAGIIGPKSSK
jgi:hypothetical protein